LALVANFLAPRRRPPVRQRHLRPPQPVYLVDDGKIYPHVLGVTMTIDRRRCDAPTCRTRRPKSIQFFVTGDPYRLMGLFPTDVHLFGLPSSADFGIFLLGTDRQGRDPVFATARGQPDLADNRLVGVI
jgi:peptide/nickel transport system permease protein